MTEIKKFLEKIPDNAAIRVAVALRGQLEEMRTDAFYRKGDAPCFFLVFPDDEFHLDTVDTGRTSTVTFTNGDQSTTILSDITGLSNMRTLALKGKEIISRSQLRSYFRVDAVVAVRLSLPSTKKTNKKSSVCDITGDTIDLSGSGLMCSIDKPLAEEQQVKIELTLPGKKTHTAIAYGSVVRCRQVDEKKYHVALRFDTIDEENRDKIIAHCFELQRQYLKMRAQLKNKENF